MEKTLSQEEIDALFNNANYIQNSSDTNAVEVDQEKIDELSNYLYNQNQDFIKDIIAERENKETDEYSDEELEYINSPYYLNMYNLIANIDQVADSFIQNITYAVVQRRYCDKCNCSFCIYNVGFPVPDRFLKQFKLSLKMKLDQLIQIEGWGNMNIDIKPVEYSNQYSVSENFYKQTNYYIIDISLKRVKSDINFTKK